MGKKISFIQQLNNLDCGTACLTMILNYFGNSVPLYQVNRMVETSRNGITVGELKRGAKSFGLDGKVYRINRLEEIELGDYCPVIALLDNNHYVIIESIKSENYIIIDPEDGRKKVEKNSFYEQFSNIIIHFIPNDNFNKTKKQYKYFQIIKENICNKNVYLRIFLFTIIINGISFIIPKISRIIIDKIITEKRGDMIISISFLALFVVLLYGVFYYIRKSNILKLEIEFGQNMSYRIITKLFNLPIEFFSIREVGDLSTRINNIDVAKDIVSRTISTFLIDVITIIIFGVTMFIYYGGLALIVLILGMIQGIILFFGISKIKKYIIKNIKSNEECQAYLIQVLSNILFLKISSSVEIIIEEWKKKYNRKMKTYVDKQKYSIIIESVIRVLSLMPQLFILILGSSYVLSEKMTLGSLIAFISLSGFFLSPIASIANNMQELHYLKTVFDRLMDIYYYDETKDGYKKKKLCYLDKIEFRNVSFSYSKSAEIALDKICIELNQGEKVAIVGQSGCGKSTLIKVLLGLYMKNIEGEVLVNGKSLKKIDMESYRNKIGVVLQDAYFFNDCIQNNIDLTRIGNEDRIRLASEIACVHKEIQKMPLKYKTIIGENGKNISGGQKQRISIARALLNSPSIIIFDEATSQIDSKNEKKIYDNLKKNNISQIVVTHRLSTILDADRIYVMNEGKIVEFGNHRDLLNMKGVYYSLWEEQNFVKFTG